MAAVLMPWFVKGDVGRRQGADFRLETAHVAVHADVSSQGICITLYHKVSHLLVGRPESRLSRARP